jgi:uncharacterized membrane protein
MGGDVNMAGRMGLAFVFAYAALGHFVRTDAMAEMIPPSVPRRRALIQVSGVFELVLAILVLAWPKSRLVGFVIIGFLIRAPLQLLLILWTYWFVLRGGAT